MSARYIAERGSGSNGTAYNLKDWEILDLERAPARRVVCRATQSDAAMIVAALNSQVAASAGKIAA